MVLLFDTDRNARTGWHGYDIAINRRMGNEGTSVVEHTADGWNWQPQGHARLTVGSHELMLAVPRALLSLPEGDAPLDFEFKWADNFARDDDIDAFTLNGDSAPPGRFNYRYHTDP